MIYELDVLHIININIVFPLRYANLFDFDLLLRITHA